MGNRPLRVMQSFKEPRPTTNPYIVQLDRALADQVGIVHLRLSRPRALLGRIDVLHLHWPETLIGGSTPWKRFLKRSYLWALLLKLRVEGAALVRTSHNVEIPQDATPAERRLLEAIEERADLRILLTPETTLPWHSPTRVIPHGHYVDWFADVPRVEAVADQLGFVGLVRRYKGVEGLIEAFSATAQQAEQMRLRISGNPTSTGLAEEIRHLSQGDPRIELDLRFLPERDFATAIMRCAGVVLPYRFMHNSGSLLAALSVARPVLVPRTAVNEALAEEVGAGWIHMFDGDLTPEDLIGFWEAVSPGLSGVPDLSGRDWVHAGADHVGAYRRAVEAHRERGIRPARDRVLTPAR